MAKASRCALPVAIVAGIAAAIVVLNREDTVPIEDTNAWIPRLQQGGSIKIEKEVVDPEGRIRIKHETAWKALGAIEPPAIQSIADTWTSAAEAFEKKLNEQASPLGDDPVERLEQALSEASRLVWIGRYRRAVEMLQQGDYVTLGMDTNPPEAPDRDLVSIGPVRLSGRPDPVRISVYIPIEGKLKELHDYAAEIRRELHVAICNKFNALPLATRKSRFEQSDAARRQLDSIQKGEINRTRRQQGALRKLLLDSRVGHDRKRFRYVAF